MIKFLLFTMSNKGRCPQVTDTICSQQQGLQTADCVLQVYKQASET